MLFWKMKTIEEIKKQLCKSIQEEPNLFIERLDIKKKQILEINEKNNHADLKQVKLEIDIVEDDYCVVHLEEKITGLNKVENTKTCEICLVRRILHEKSIKFYLFELKSSLGNSKNPSINSLQGKFNNSISRIYFLLLMEKYVFNDISDYKPSFSFFIFYKKLGSNKIKQEGKLVDILYKNSLKKGLIEVETIIDKIKAHINFIDTEDNSHFPISLSTLIK